MSTKSRRHPELVRLRDGLGTVTLTGEAIGQVTGTKGNWRYLRRGTPDTVGPYFTGLEAAEALANDHLKESRS